MSRAKDQTLIAIFAGLMPESDRCVVWYDPDRAYFGVGCRYTDDLKFNESWDWYMKAYRKAKDFLNDMDRPSKNHCCKGDLLEVDIHCAVVEIDIKKAYIALVKFVEWYNEYVEKLK